MRHFTEHCSATTITPGPNTLLLSAWHCFEDYAATQGPIRLFAQHSPETPLPLRMTRTVWSLPPPADLHNPIAWPKKGHQAALFLDAQPAAVSE